MHDLADPLAPIPERYQGLVFDCDGTLVDTMPAHYRAWRAALDPLGIMLDEARFHALAGVPTAAIVELLAREQRVRCDPVAVAHDKDARYLALEERGAAIELVVSIARREQGRRKLAVASGGLRSVVLSTLRSAGLDAMFPVVVAAENVRHGKPAPDVFLCAAERLGVDPSRCVAYEDADLGLQAARAAGMAAVDVRPWLLPR
ncbi:MAG: HAD-IA family hydrolase [Deltaproteobacteria bacterium]|nr:HAD-IA family hydrolase [Deltaproteobacteria bacterium]